MSPLFILLLLGVFTYFIVQRQVAGLTRTPVWLLWLVAMTPALIWMLWAIAFGNTKPLPAWLVWVPFVVCLGLYWKLLHAGRIIPPAKVQTDRPALPPAEADPVVPMLEPSRPINAVEEKSLQTCFPWSVYYLQQIDYRPQAVICRGQLRSQPDVAYKTIRDNVEGVFGNRFFVIFQEGLNGKPFFALVPNTLASASARPALSRPAIALGLLFMTLLTTTLGWTQLQGQALNLSPGIFLNGLPYALTLLWILGAHELGHYLTARRYKIRVTLPAFIPIIPMPLFPFGTFGAFTQMRSPVPHRRALFDVSIAGPLCAVMVAVPFLLWGLSLSTVVPQATPAGVLTFQAIDPNISLLFTLVSKLVLGNTLTVDTAIHLHPVALASCLGLMLTAYNLMPVGPLDGGHIVHAMFGQRTGAIIGQIFRLLLLAVAFFQQQQHLWVWAILLLLLPALDEPTLNDVTELDSRRDLWGLAAMGLLLLIILPTPGFLSRLFNV
jgi:membrane-associated protease RseP (regulator of RpoE activity)